MSVARCLEREYQSPRLGNPEGPLDDLFYVLLSNRTGPSVARDLYSEVKSRFASWDEIAEAPRETLEAVLARGGLAVKKSTQIKGILNRLREDFGRATLDPVARYETPEAEEYLCSLPGVSQKLAKCVLMYGMDREVLPVDAHVHRITKRLGWHHHRRADQSHETLEGVVPARLRYSFHVNCVAHGRLVCRARWPRCSECPILQFCIYGQTLKGNRRAEGDT